MYRHKFSDNMKKPCAKVSHNVSGCFWDISWNVQRNVLNMVEPSFVILPHINKKIAGEGFDPPTFGL